MSTTQGTATLTGSGHLNVNGSLIIPVSAELKITWYVLESVSSEPLQLEWNVGQPVPGLIRVPSGGWISLVRQDTRRMTNPGWISMQGGAD